MAATNGNVNDKAAPTYLELREKEGSFDRFLWGFTGGRTRHNSFRTIREIPARSPESEAMSRALAERGFRFVGPTICYAFMQAVGMVHDHTVDCFRYRKARAIMRPHEPGPRRRPEKA